MGNRGKAVQTALMPFFLAHTYAQINLCINTHTINSKCAHPGGGGGGGGENSDASLTGQIPSASLTG